MQRQVTAKGRVKWARNKCDWCGRYFQCCQYRTKTCGNKCRLRLHRFKLNTGFAPVKPPGDITTQAALDLLIVELIRRERERLSAIERG